MSAMDDVRGNRKHEHIAAVKTLAEFGGTGFADVVLLPKTASEMNVNDVSLTTQFLNRSVASPIVINAMTGGTAESVKINRCLARFAGRHGLAMAVGSQTAALKDSLLRDSYTIVRQVNPLGVLMANVPMGTCPSDAQQAIDMIGADALQVHWNTAQELFMSEGDREFSGFLEQFQAVAQSISVPTIAKEVGQGMTAGTAQHFVDLGAGGIDIGGMGGTNFIAIEAWRRGELLEDEWQKWGIPTVASLGEVVATMPAHIPIIASGGIRGAHDMAKALALGATVVGVAGPVMRLATRDHAEEALDGWLYQTHWTLKMLMVLLGVRTVSELRTRPVVLKGASQNWLELRGYGSFVQRLARRS